jgi:hypothetical protein
LAGELGMALVWVRDLVKLGLFALVGLGLGIGVLEEQEQLGQRGSPVVIE